MIENLALQGQLDSAVYGFKLNNGLHNDESIMTLGTPDPALYTEMVYVPVVKPQGVLPGMWFMEMHRVSMSFAFDSGISETGIIHPCLKFPCFGLVDTGTSFMYFPTPSFNLFAYFLQQVRPDCFVVDGTGPIICMSQTLEYLPDLEFTVNGKKLTVTPDSYATVFPDSMRIAICAGSERFFGPTFFLLGDAFIREFYTVFDQEQNRIGFGTDSSFKEAEFSRATNTQNHWHRYIAYGGIGSGLVLIAIAFRIRQQERLHSA